MKIRWLVLLNLILALPILFAVTAYEYYQRDRIASFITEGQKNNLISQNLSAAASGFASLSPLFNRVDLMSDTGRRRLLGVDPDASSFFDISISKQVVEGKRLVHASNVVFVYSWWSSLLPACVLFCALSLMVTPASVFIQREISFRNEARLKSELSEQRYREAVQVAHDIRSPISVLNAVVARLDEDSEAGQLIRHAAVRIDRIAADTLDRSLKRVSELYDVNRALAQLIAEKKIEFGESAEVVGIFDPALEYKTLRINPSDFLRIVSNLLNNAYEARMPNQKLRIEIRSTAGADVAKFSVTDSGKGIDAAKLKLIGERGYSSGKVNSGASTGLGIWSAKSVLALSGGSLTYSSRLGEGSVFTVTVPTKPT